MTRISYDERIRIFGQPGRVARQQVTTPWGLRVWCHELLSGRFLAACHLADRVSSWKPRRIDSFNYRPVRGSSSPSLHGFACAWDFFDRPYPEPVDVWGAANAPTRDFREAFKAFGFALGAEFTSRPDVPHIEWAAGRPAPITAVPIVSPEEDDDMTPEEHDKLEAAWVQATEANNRAKNFERWLPKIAAQLGIDFAELDKK